MSSTEGSIRLARASDEPRYAVIERAAAALYAPWGLDGAFADTPTEAARVARAIAEGELVATTDAQDVMVGYALIGRDGDDLHLEELAVEPVHGRRGRGTALVHAVIGLARDRGARRVTLVTLDFVPFGAPFYARLGFAPIPADALSPALRELAPPDVRDGRIAMALAVTG